MCRSPEYSLDILCGENPGVLIEGRIQRECSGLLLVSALLACSNNNVACLPFYEATGTFAGCPFILKGHAEVSARRCRAARAPVPAPECVWWWGCSQPPLERMRARTPRGREMEQSRPQSGQGLVAQWPRVSVDVFVSQGEPQRSNSAGISPERRRRDRADRTVRPLRAAFLPASGLTSHGLSSEVAVGPCPCQGKVAAWDAKTSALGLQCSGWHAAPGVRSLVSSPGGFTAAGGAALQTSADLLTPWGAVWSLRCFWWLWDVLYMVSFLGRGQRAVHVGTTGTLMRRSPVILE